MVPVPVQICVNNTIVLHPCQHFTHAYTPSSISNTDDESGKSTCTYLYSVPLYITYCTVAAEKNEQHGGHPIINSRYLHRWIRILRAFSFSESSQRVTVTFRCSPIEMGTLWSQGEKKELEWCSSTDRSCVQCLSTELTFPIGDSILYQLLRLSMGYNVRAFN